MVVRFEIAVDAKVEFVCVCEGLHNASENVIMVVDGLMCLVCGLSVEDDVEVIECVSVLSIAHLRVFCCSLVLFVLDGTSMGACGRVQGVCSLCVILGALVCGERVVSNEASMSDEVYLVPLFCLFCLSMQYFSSALNCIFLYALNKKFQNMMIVSVLV